MSQTKKTIKSFVAFVSFFTMAFGPIISAACPPNPSINIETINGVPAPFDFSCPNNPLETREITLTGSGQGTTPPGNRSQYRVQIKWGDGSVTNGLGTFTPNSGQGTFTFTYNGTHTYAADGSYTIKARLYHSQPPGNDGQADAVSTLNICVSNVPVCGNGILENDEQCDAGCQNGVPCTPPYGSTCNYCSSQCETVTLTGPYCGDGIKNGAELCDGTDGVPEHYTCTQECTLEYVPFCGDQIINGNELCEIGNTNPCTTCDGYQGYEPCSQDCMGWGDCIPTESCGDGILNNSEQCDNGTQNGQTCTPSYGGSCQYCSNVCVLVTENGPFCGDQIINGDEICEIGNTQECITQEGYSGLKVCNDQCSGWGDCTSTQHCGDGMINGNEQCDDGNTQNGDGCSAQCTNEQPQTYCGDGNIDPGEECEIDDDCGEGYFCNSCKCEQELPICDPNQELISNGDFESPVVINSAKWDIFSTSQLASWIVEWATSEPSYQGYPRPTDAYLELQRGVNGWLPQASEQHAELDSDWDGPAGSLSNEPASVRIYQDISTISGKNYNISFYFSPRPSTDNSENQLEFSWDGDIKDTLTGNGGSNTDWNQHTYEFTATGSTTRLQFTDKGIPNSLGTFLDTVSVRCNPTPEPECTFGQTQSCDTGLLGICSAGIKTCTEGGTWGSCIQNNQSTTENCSNQLDDDCDGFVDGADPDCQITPPTECTFGQTRSCETGNLGICATGTQTCTEVGTWGSCIQTNQITIENCSNGLDDDCDGFVDSNDTNCQPPLPSCGDQICNGEETCSTCSQDCGSCGGGVPMSPGGGGGISIIDLHIFSEYNQNIETTGAYLTWFTNIPATSRVVYDTVPHANILTPPNYGYAFSTIEDSTKVIFHIVHVTGLTPGTTYYWRAISHGSGEALGQELIFTTSVSVPTPTPTPTPSPSPTPTPTPTPSPTPEEQPSGTEIPPSETTGGTETSAGGGVLSGLMAAVTNVFSGKNLCPILLLLILILIALLGLTLYKSRKKEYRILIISIIILILILLYRGMCWWKYWWTILLIALIVAIVSYILGERKNKQAKIEFLK